MAIEVKIPSPGESISEVELASWLVANGDLVQKDQELAMIESDKATLSLIAPEAGKIEILIEEGETVKVDSVACRIDTAVEVPNEEIESVDTPREESKTDNEEQLKDPTKESATDEGRTEKESTTTRDEKPSKIKTTPLARKIMEEEKVSVDDIINGLRRLSASDVERVINEPAKHVRTSTFSSEPRERVVDREKMSQLRKHLSKRLVQAKNETAMLTTFNEVDMQSLMLLRSKHQKKFVEKYGYKIGLISFFLKACAIALKKHPKINSQMDGEEILHPSYADISVAVQSPKGLMVPVIRDVDTLGLAQIESQLKELADKAMSGRISMDEMSGGTFTLTNGGVFGSMMSTPLINPPQSAIIGMHNIIDRPVAVNGKVEIRPMMYIALSYDHRIIDGKDSVSFLVDVKRMIENPGSMLYGGNDEGQELLEL